MRWKWISCGSGCVCLWGGGGLLLVVVVGERANAQTVHFVYWTIWVIYAFVASLRTLCPRNDAWILVAALFNSGSLKSMSNSSATFFVISCKSLSSLRSLPPFRAKWPRKAAWMRTAASQSSVKWNRRRKTEKKRNSKINIVTNNNSTQKSITTLSAETCRAQNSDVLDIMDIFSFSQYSLP